MSLVKQFQYASIPPGCCSDSVWKQAGGTCNSTPFGGMDTKVDYAVTRGGLAGSFAILVLVMRVLFAILVVAFAGLLWATIAAAQHIRRARRRRRSQHAPGSPIRTAAPPPSLAGDLSASIPRQRLPRAKQLQTHF